MKTSEPFWGVQKPVVARIAKLLIAEHPIANRADFMRDVQTVWDGATHREERYCAIDFTGDRRARELHTTEILPLYEHMIRTGQWWDLIDAIAPPRFPLIFERDDRMPGVMRQWACDDNLWIRRAAILSQLKRKADTDLGLLEDCLAPSLTSREFFLRKAIGWALRQFARTDPNYVRGYLERHRHEMSGLSIREAEKHLTAA